MNVTPAFGPFQIQADLLHAKSEGSESTRLTQASDMSDRGVPLKFREKNQ